jgi:hypothetical protein
MHLACFEKTFPVGLANATSPHVDVAALGEMGLVAIESKCTEYLSRKTPHFSDRYETEITDERTAGPWYAEMRRLKELKAPLRLDASQLILHALGLARRVGPATLVYLYWEPLDAELRPLFAEHRAEIADLATRVRCGKPSFEYLSYKELWDYWAASRDPALTAHVVNLRARYAVRAFAAEDPVQINGPVRATR